MKVEEGDRPASMAQHTDHKAQQICKYNNLLQLTGTKDSDLQLFFLTKA